VLPAVPSSISKIKTPCLADFNMAVPEVTGEADGETDAYPRKTAKPKNILIFRSGITPVFVYITPLQHTTVIV
jgi:hypothetical protein